MPAGTASRGAGTRAARRSPRTSLAAKIGVTPGWRRRCASSASPPAAMSDGHSTASVVARASSNFLHCGVVGAAAVDRLRIARARCADEADRCDDRVRRGARSMSRAASLVGEADDHVDRIGGEVAGLDDGDARALQQSSRVARMRDVGQHDAVGAAAEERRDQLLLDVERVAAVADQRLETVGAQRLGQRRRRSRRRSTRSASARRCRRVVSRPRVQAARDEVGDVAGLLDGALDASTGLRRHLVSGSAACATR